MIRHLNRTTLWIWLFLCVLGRAPLAQVLKVDKDATLEFYWSPATGNVHCYNVYLSTDGDPYELVGNTAPGSAAPTIDEPYSIVVERGHIYRVRVAAVDPDGNIGPMSDESDQVAVVDVILTSPNGGEVQRGGSSQDITWNILGPGGVIDHIRLLYSIDGGSTYPNTVVTSTACDGTYQWTVPTIDSSMVRVKAIAEDSSNAELASDASDNSFIIDSTAPSTTATPDGTLGENEWYTSDVTVTLSAADSLSNVKETKYKINDGEWQTYLGSFTITGSTVYYRSEDEAGNVEAEKSLEVNIDKTVPLVPDVTDEGFHTNSTTQLYASWTASIDAESGVAEYQYAIGTTSGGTDVVNWTSVGTNANTTATNLSLTDGETYYFSVQAKNGAGLWSDTGISDGILVVDGIYGDASRNGTISAYDAALVLQKAVELIGFTPQQRVLGDVSGNSTVTSYDAALILQYGVGIIGSFPVESSGQSSSLSVSNSTPAVEVSVPSLAGQAGSSVTIPIKISDTIGLGIIGVDIILTYEPSILTAIDAVTEGTIASGWMIDKNISSGQIAIGVSSAYALSGAGTLVKVNFSVSEAASNGQTSQLTLSNVSLNEGSVSATITHGVFEVRPVSITIFSPNGGEKLRGGNICDITWITGGGGIDHIHLLYSTDSGANYQDIVANTTDTGTYEWATPLIDSLTVRVKAIAEDAGNNALAYDESDADFIIDSSAPSMPVVIDGGDSTSCSFRLHASWTSSDPESDVVEYQYAIDETLGGSDVVGWTSVGADTDVIATGLSLINGRTYYFSVKARNGAGIWSDVGVSDGIVVEVTAGQVDLYLYKGWNLISIYVHTDVELSTILEQQIRGLYTAVWTYDNASRSWKRHIPDGSIEFNTMEAGKGYWINMIDRAQLTVPGELVADPTIQLNTGWNLVGHNSSQPLSLDEAPFSGYTSIWTYDSETETWLRHIVDDVPGFLNTLIRLEPGKGYWIYVE